MELQDKIGREDIVNKINTLVDNLRTDEHICIALNGEWGSGKTFVMHMLQEKFREYPEYIVINYDAWKNNFYSDPLIAILYCLLDGIKEYMSTLPEVKEKVKSGVLKSLKSFGKDALSAMKKSGGKVALFAHIIEGITNIVVQSGKLESHQKFADFRSYQSLLEDIKNQLNSITSNEIYEGKQTKLVITVDEIDRCLPDEQLTVLERLHHLFDIQNCAVIIAMNKNQIIKIFDKRFGEGGKEYLRKFFDYNFFILAQSDIYFQNYLWDNVVENQNITFVKTISKEEIFFLREYVFRVLKEEFGDILKIDDRTITEILKHVLDIVLNIPEKKMDFSYLFLIVVAICLKLYNKQQYIVYFSKSTKDKLPYDIFDNLDSKTTLLRLAGNVWWGEVSYNIYADTSLNTINYYVNMWNVNGDERDEKSIERIFVRSSRNIDPKYMEKLKYIFEKINIITEWE